MATIQKQAYDAAVLNLIETAVQANPMGVYQALVNNGFGEELRYGQNGQLSQLILTQIYVADPDRLFKILNEVSVERSNVAIERRAELDEIVKTAPTSSAARGEGLSWWQKAVNLVRPTTTVTEGGEEIERTNPVAYVVYVLGFVAIILLVRWIYKSVS